MFWKKKKKTAPTDYRKAHHYTYAHWTLRKMAYDVPGALILKKAHRDARGLAKHLWKQTCEQCQGIPTRLKASDFAFEILKINGQPTLYVKMPRVSAMGEAHCVAIVYDHDLPEVDTSTSAYDNYRYFLLEAGYEGRNPVCEWKGDNHLNYGPVERANPQAFFARIEEIIQANSAPEAALVREETTADQTEEPGSTPEDDAMMADLKELMLTAARRFGEGESAESISKSLIADGVDEGLVTIAVGMAELAKDSVEDEMRPFLR